MLSYTQVYSPSVFLPQNIVSVVYNLIKFACPPLNAKFSGSEKFIFYFIMS